MNFSARSDLSQAKKVKNLTEEKSELSLKLAFHESISPSVGVFFGFVLLYLSCLFIGKLDSVYAKPFYDLRHMLKEHALEMRVSYVFIPILPLLLITLVRGHKFEWFARNLARFILPAIAHLLLAASAIWAVEVSVLVKNLSWLGISVLAGLLIACVFQAGLLIVAGEWATKLKNSDGKYRSWIELFLSSALTFLIVYFLPILHSMKLPVIESH